MPRRGGQGGGKGGRQWNQANGGQQRFNGNYFDDINDMNRKLQESKRRVSFKASGGPGGRHGSKNINEMAIRAHMEDDEEMRGTEFHARRGNFRGKGGRMNRSGSPVPRTRTSKKIIPGTSGWFLVTIPYGQKHDKSFILKSLLDAITPQTFIAHYYKTDEMASSFYVDDLKMAEALLNADRQIQMPDGFRLSVRVRNSIPQVQVDASLRERMKQAMVKRYSPATRALDLTKFHSDPELLDIFCALFRPTIMLAAFDIIAENVPNLEALNLADNKIHLLDHFKCLANKLPHLNVLYLGNNRISTMSSLDSLKTLPLVDLVLEGNPVKDRMRDQTIYVSEIRKRFPKLLKLDGAELPPQIGFDVAEDLTLPTAKASFLCDPNGSDMVRQFLEQYFIIYDSDNRQPLLDAYHEQAMFSMTAMHTNQQNQRLSSYLGNSRNLLRIRDHEARSRQVKTGRLPVVSLLSQLPSTQHDPQSFGVDMTLFTPQLILLTVTGLFKEKSAGSSASNQPLRSFQRTLVIVPSGSGFCIRNELLHINNVTGTQERAAFKAAPTATTSQQVPQPNVGGLQNRLNVASPIAPSTSIVHAVSPSMQPTAPGIDDATKMQMVHAMAEQSKMNLEWSKKCLEETNWDFQRAGFVFTELHKQNKIPPDAFVK